LNGNINRLMILTRGKWWAFVANTCVAIADRAYTVERRASMLRMHAAQHLYLLRRQREALDK
jgi:hypothetical protein